TISGTTSFASAVGSRIPHWPDMRGAPKLHARMIKGLPRPAMTGKASIAPAFASLRISGTGLISLRIGENPEMTVPRVNFIGNGRDAIALAPAARTSAGNASRRANDSTRNSSFADVVVV